MGTIAKWHGHTFVVKPHEIRSFTDLKVTAGCDTEDKTMDSEKYVVRKSSSAYIISLTAVLDVRTADYGGNVQSAAMDICDDIYNSEEDYFYMGGSKLFAQKLMGVKATVQNIEIGANGAWRRCEVAMELKQSTKGDGTIAPAGGKKKPGKKSIARKDILAILPQDKVGRVLERVAAKMVVLSARANSDAIYKKARTGASGAYFSVPSDKVSKEE